MVASAVPSAGGAALEVDPFDVDAIAAALVTAATDEGRRAELVARGPGPGRGAHVGGHRPPPRRAVGGDGVRVTLDASAIPDPPGGAGRYVLALAEALSRRDDVDLTVVARSGDAARWPEPVVAEAPARRPVRLGWEQVGLPRAVRAAGADVHHGPHYTMPLAVGVPTVVTIHDLSFFTHPEWHQRTKVAFFRAAIRTSARRAAALVAVSADDRRPARRPGVAAGARPRHPPRRRPRPLPTRRSGRRRCGPGPGAA